MHNKIVNFISRMIISDHNFLNQIIIKTDLTRSEVGYTIFTFSNSFVECVTQLLNNICDVNDIIYWINLYLRKLLCLILMSI